MSLAFVTDDAGRTWIGKGDGLSCYNGEFYLVYGGEGDGTVMPEAHVRDLCIGLDGRLWIGDNAGVHYMKDGAFFSLDTGISFVVMRVISYSDGGVVFTSRGGVFRYTSDGNLLNFQRPGLPFTSHVAVAHSGRIWAATAFLGSNCIYALSPSLEKEFEFTLPQDVNVLDLITVGNDEVWVATDSGIFVFSDSSFERKDVPSPVSETVDGKDILFIREVINGRGVILGLRNEGLFAYLPSAERTYRFLEEERLQSWDYNCYVSPSGKIWLSDEKGTTKTYWSDNIFNNLFPTIQPDYYSSANEICTDSKGNIWIARNEWLLGYDPVSESVFQKIHSKKGFVNITIDKRDRIWAMIGRDEISIYDIVDGKAVFYGTRKFHDQWISFVRSDSGGRIWIGTSSGLRMLESGKEKVFPLDSINVTLFNSFIDGGTGDLYLHGRDGELYRYSDSLIKVDFLPSYIKSVGLIHTFADGTVCVSSSNDGVFIKSSGDTSFVHLGISEGLPSNEVRGIAGDRDGNLWVATKYRVSKVDTHSLEITNFSVSGFAPAKPFSRTGGYVGADGNVYFGGEGGVAKIDVSRNLQKLENPLTRIDFLSVNDIPIIPVPSSLKLSRKENDLKFCFSPIGENQVDNVTLQFMLKGLDKDWNRSFIPEASYHSLRPGRYTFLVKSGSNGNVGEASEVSIVIKPHPLASTFAKILYMILILGMATYLVRLYTSINIQKEKARSAEAREQMRKDEVDYLTNVAHELRNPLTMIYGPLNQLSKDPSVPEEDRNLIKASANAASRLREITDEILDISRPSADKDALKVSESDISRVLGGISEGFRYAFKDRNITFATNIPDGLHGWVDTDKFYKILANLLSNAVKYTPEGGHAELSMNLPGEDGMLKVSVSDDGPGIPLDKREAIFERFERLENDAQGSGIGLHYSRKLAQLHKGDITLSDTVAGGPRFTFDVPILKDAYSDAEIVADPLRTDSLVLETDFVNKVDPSKKTLLVVEDNPEIRAYLYYIFINTYNVYVMPDAENALENMKVVVPDIILSDYIMPGMDGMGFCKAVKDNPAYCHIPFVLLTGKADSETHTLGLEGGADSFMPKPFDPSVLKATVESLLRAREQFQNKVLSMDMESVPSTDDDISAISDRDRSFLSKLAAEVGENISNAGFTIDELSKKMFMSYSSLYASTKTLTGLTPQAYLVRRRMEAAKDLVLEGKHSMTEISEMVGYGSLSHFSREFKKYFGENPSTFSESGMNREHPKGVQ
ncbi:MAG: helix-turn-helix domain-containing protein [Bacteroidales bacterium]|nr:helix-turn-helix domain-containing protein [Bacteroidales bacterium]